MTPSTSKPAKLLTSLWMRLSCGGGGGVGGMGPCQEGQKARRRGEEAKLLKSDSHYCLKDTLTF